ncbi:DUF3050 domain-containing protein [Olivibacter sitiensis]|uniref:DUF3050 domain-containing protein n=1 Tax=Olivibacter sitiensis TaxID=376470 RepID=UPI000404532D|nr:DUF3050 domain-containing protein [Olivibacter sitiensis]
MENKLAQLKRDIEPFRKQIVDHPLYASIMSIDDLNTFMEYHVFAVWDFMSLLKALQNALTCTTVPWFPVGDPETRYLINEIVTGEESDLDQHGRRKSHYELYLEAMEQSGSNTSSMLLLEQQLRAGHTLDDSAKTAQIPIEAADFIRQTFDIIHSGKAHVQAAVFTFGREDLIPDMFINIVRDINKSLSNSISIYKYYLERHIEVDGDHHSHLALQMTAKLCGNDEEKWQQATDGVIKALQARIRLWDGALEVLKHKEKSFMHTTMQ